MARPTRQVRKRGRFGMPLCQRCFTLEFESAHEPDLCVMRVVASMNKALHNYQLWQDRYNALANDPAIDPEIVVGHSIGQSLLRGGES